LVNAIGNATDGKSYLQKVGNTQPIASVEKIADTTKSNQKIAKDININDLDIDISQIFSQKRTEPENGRELSKSEAEKEDVEKAAEELSSVVQSMGANLAFAIHERTNRLMVRMVDSDGNILKEYPSTEFLDMVSRIRDYVGSLLDKKA
jgi:flagellar protein FlaG